MVDVERYSSVLHLVSIHLVNQLFNGYFFYQPSLVMSEYNDFPNFSRDSFTNHAVLV